MPDGGLKGVFIKQRSTHDHKKAALEKKSANCGAGRRLGSLAEGRGGRISALTWSAMAFLAINSGRPDTLVGRSQKFQAETAQGVNQPANMLPRFADDQAAGAGASRRGF